MIIFTILLNVYRFLRLHTKSFIYNTFIHKGFIGSWKAYLVLFLLIFFGYKYYFSTPDKEDLSQTSKQEIQIANVLLKESNNVLKQSNEYLNDLNKKESTIKEVELDIISENYKLGLDLESIKAEVAKIDVEYFKSTNIPDNKVQKRKVSDKTLKKLKKLNKLTKKLVI